MAHPIYSFKHPETQEQYFQIWDTFTELPETVPMNLITFLQYWGIDDKEKISVLYSIYPRLIRTGTSLLDYSFDKLPKHLQQQAFDYIALGIDIPSEEEKALNTQLEDLFAQEQSFFEFYSTYSQMIQSINPYPKRPLNYYLSWSRTQCYLDLNDERIIQRIEGLIGQFQLPQEVFTIEDNRYDLCDWLESNVFNDYPEAMVELFLYLGKHNLILIDAIPHVIRTNEIFKKLFTDFGMESFLPEKAIQYDVCDVSSHEWVDLSDARYSRQFVNAFTFEEDESELMGLRLQDMRKDELINLLYEKCYVSSDNLVNVKDKYGSFLLPMKYSSHYTLDSFDRFFVLAPFDRQCYDILDKRGKLVEEGGYYDFYFINETIGYFQYTDNLSWVRWEYNDETGEIEIDPVKKPNKYSEDEWARIEREYQKELQQTPENDNVDEQFKLLELKFRSDGQWHSLYLMNKYTLSADKIRKQMTEHLNSLLFDEIDLTNPTEAGVELYKSLVSSNNWDVKFKPACLNRFTLTYGSGGVNSRFQANYRNDDFNEQGIHKKTLDRAVVSFHCLQIIEESEHSDKVFTAYLIVNNFTAQFHADCEAFTQENPPNEDTEDSGTYGERLLTYLKSKGYEEAIAYKQCLDVDAIRELLGIELNEQGRFPQPDRTQLNEDDDLPF